MKYQGEVPVVGEWMKTLGPLRRLLFDLLYALMPKAEFPFSALGYRRWLKQKVEGTFWDQWAALVDEQPPGYVDKSIIMSEIYLDKRDRIKLLFSGRLENRVVLHSENKPGMIMARSIVRVENKQWRKRKQIAYTSDSSR